MVSLESGSDNFSKIQEGSVHNAGDKEVLNLDSWGLEFTL